MALLAAFNRIDQLLGVGYCDCGPCPGDCVENPCDHGSQEADAAAARELALALFQLTGLSNDPGPNQKFVRPNTAGTPAGEERR